MAAPRFFRQTELQASQASQLLQVHWCSQSQMLARSTVGAGLPAMAAPRFFRQTKLQASQASQLPQVHWRSQHLMLACSTVGAGLPAMAAPRFFRQTELQASQASQLPQVHWCFRYLGASLWERACSRWHRREIPDRPGRKHRRQASSHRSWGASAIWGHHCGSGLARDGISAKHLTDRAACIAGKPAPTRRSVFSGTPSKSPGVH
jgi:hypothetical protein